MDARVRAVQKLAIIKWTDTREEPAETGNIQQKAYQQDPRISLDAIGQPRGIPEEFMARSEVAAGFESILVWLMINKNVEWINHIYYNQIDSLY